MAIRCLVGKGHKQGFLRLLHSSSFSPSPSPVPIPTSTATKTQRSDSVEYHNSPARIRFTGRRRLLRPPGSVYGLCRPPYGYSLMFRVQFALDAISQIQKKDYELVGLLYFNRGIACAGITYTITLEAKAEGKKKFYKATIADKIALHSGLTLSRWDECWPKADIRKSYNEWQLKGLGEEHQGDKGRIGADKG